MSTWSPSTPPNTQLDQLSEDASVDVLVIGAGGAGMSSALFAALRGARVLLVESTEYLGGTTALSAGTSWVPNTAKGLAVEPGDTPERAKTFLNHAVGDKAEAALRDAFVDHGPKAVATLGPTQKCSTKCARCTLTTSQSWKARCCAAARSNPCRLTGADSVLP